MRPCGAVAVARADIFHGMVNQLTALPVLVFGCFVGQRLCQNRREEGEGKQEGCKDSFESHVVCVQGEVEAAEGGGALLKSSAKVLIIYDIANLSPSFL